MENATFRIFSIPQPNRYRRLLRSTVPCNYGWVLLYRPTVLRNVGKMGINDNARLISLIIHSERKAFWEGERASPIASLDMEYFYYVP